MNLNRVILVGAGEDRHIQELSRLAATLGIEVVGQLEQPRRDHAGYLGKGKRQELAELREELDADAVIADDELKASQARVLERDSGVEVIDRTELIIRIFEAHARDAASKLQVELADLEYRLPRMKGRGEFMSRLGGGVGTRGPGEQQLEYDRRVIREKIRSIRRKLAQERDARSIQSMRLNKSGPPAVALVGYTNAGKTTTLNALTGADRSVRDWLFETLETTTRLVEGGRGSSDIVHPDFVITDTVGFIRKLPTQLVESFAATLQAARDADIIVLCADASSEDLDDEINTVRETLEESGISTSEDPILCLNKVDLVPDTAVLDRKYPGAVKISALQDVDPLRKAIYERISESRTRMKILIPHAEYPLATRLYGVAEIHATEETEDGICMDVTLSRETAPKYAPYRVVAV